MIKCPGCNRLCGVAESLLLGTTLWYRCPRCRTAFTSAETRALARGTLPSSMLLGEASEDEETTPSDAKETVKVRRFGHDSVAPVAVPKPRPSERPTLSPPNPSSPPLRDAIPRAFPRSLTIGLLAASLLVGALVVETARRSTTQRTSAREVTLTSASLAADADRDLADGRYGTADAEYAQVLAKDPNNVRARLGAADAAWELGDVARARWLYRGLLVDGGVESLPARVVERGL